MTLEIRSEVAGLPLSATLRANQAAAQQRHQGKTVYHMGFGQAPFPVHPLLARALADNAAANLYEPVAGVKDVRDAALDYFAARLDVNPDDYELLVAPGSKLILFALQLAVAGDVMVPVPSWVSYAPQAAMLGDKIIHVPTMLSDEGYRFDFATLGKTLAEARKAGCNPTKLILNFPNNPTGLNLPLADHQQLAEWCVAENILIISDEIYALTSFDEPHTSIGRCAPGAAITTGLSKHVSLGGWRIGFGLIPRSIPGLFSALSSIASETWSAVSAPVQRAAVVAVSGHPEIENYVTQNTRIHAAVTRYVANRLRDAGIGCPWPAGAFYLWPDFAVLRQQLAAEGFRTSQQLADALLQDHQVLALPGDAFGAAKDALCLRLAITDYDGATALQLCEQHDPATRIEQFAPRVVSGADRLCEFVARYRS